ncbi:MAG: hypothetical protein IJU35_05720 [Paludibacteraceae bacterium]|nr:hypothetical protein [Paludibacteraceae bacterium]
MTFRMEVAHKVSVLVNSGPVFDFGAWQRVNVAGEKSDNLYKSGSYDGFNLLYGFGGGLQYSFLRIEVGAEFGLLSKHDPYGSKTAVWHKPVYAALSFMF